MFSEDFAYYTETIPALYFAWGVAKVGLGEVGVHQEEFTIHPEAFAYGVTLFAVIAEAIASGEFVVDR